MRDIMLVRTVRFVAAFCFFILLFNLFSCSPANKATGISEKKDYAETRLKIKMKAGDTHQYSISLGAGDFIQIKIEQFGIDVIAKVSSGEGEDIFDSPTGELGAEDIYLLSDNNRKYEIEIYPAQKYADPGEYSISIIRKEKASGADKKWMTALASTQKADKLRTKADTRLQSIQQYESAIAQWKELRDTVQYARAMRSMGFVFIRLKNDEKAIDVFNQLLPVWKQLGDTRSEGFTHLIIGRVYDIQKNYSKSLEYNLNSLEYSIKAKDTDQESFTLMNIGDLYIHLSDKQKATDFFEHALKKNEHSKRPSVKAIILRDYATAMLSAGENDEAVQLYEQSLKQWQQTANTPEEAKTAILLAAYYDENGNKEEAIRYYRNAFDIWQKMGEQTEMNKIQALIDKFEK